MSEELDQETEAWTADEIKAAICETAAPGDPLAKDFAEDVIEKLREYRLHD